MVAVDVSAVFAMPKSLTLGIPVSVSKTFPGLMSRWMMPASCAAESAESTAHETSTARGGIERTERGSRQPGCDREVVPSRGTGGRVSSPQSYTVTMFGVGEAGGGARLGLEPATRDRLFGEIHPELLDRDVPARDVRSVAAHTSPMPPYPRRPPELVAGDEQARLVFPFPQWARHESARSMSSRSPGGELGNRPCEDEPRIGSDRGAKPWVTYSCAGGPSSTAPAGRVAPATSASGTESSPRSASDSRPKARARPSSTPSGALVTPGLIDPHTHYDLEMFWDPTLDPLPSYGMTTIVMGNCGLGIAPVRDEVRDDIADLLCFIEELPFSLSTKCVPWGWTTWSEYHAVAAQTPTTVTPFAYTAHNALRGFAMGRDAWERAATDAERELMVMLARRRARARLARDVDELVRHRSQPGAGAQPAVRRRRARRADRRARPSPPRHAASDRTRRDRPSTSAGEVVARVACR